MWFFVYGCCMSHVQWDGAFWSYIRFLHGVMSISMSRGHYGERVCKCM